MATFIENVNLVAANIRALVLTAGQTFTDIFNTKVDKITGKGLSEADFSDVEKTKLAAIAESANNYQHPSKHPVAIIDGVLYPLQFIKTDALGNTGFGYVNWSEIIGKPADMDNVEFTTQKGVANGYAPLGSDGKIHPSFLQSLNTIETFTPADQASMLALSTAGIGDIAYLPNLVIGGYDAFMLTALPSSTLANWKILNTVGVGSFNGLTGAVFVDTSSIPEGTHLYYTDARTESKIVSTITAGSNIALAYDPVLHTLTVSANDTSVLFSEILNLPTLLAGYGITDVYTKVQTDGNIATAIASLVASSPLALDTLNELAAALGNDANFSTTITNALSLKANKEAVSGAIYIGSYLTANRPILGANERVIGYNLDIGSFEGWNGTVWASVGGGATGGGGDTVFIENEYVITTNYTIPSGRSAVSVGDSSGNITINNGVTVTFGDTNSRWVVL